MERRNTALFGRRPSRTRVSAATVVVVTVVTYVLGRFVGGSDLVVASVAHLPVLVAAVLVLGGVAASIAYWNDGLLVGLSAVFGPTAAWLWLFFTSGTGAPLGGVVAQVGGYAVVATAVVGVPAYVVGRLGFVRRAEDSSPRWNEVLGPLVGDDAEQAKRTALASVGLAAVGYGVLWLADLLPGTSVRAVGDGFFAISAVSQGPVVGTAVVVFWVGIAALAAYRGGGLLGSWAVLLGPLAGGNGYLFVESGMSGAGPAVDGALALVAATIFTVALGTPGYVVGFVAGRWKGASGSDGAATDSDS